MSNKSEKKRQALDKVRELNGNVTRAARELDIPRRTLRRWIDDELSEEVGHGAMQAIEDAGVNPLQVKDMWLKSKEASIRLVMPNGSEASAEKFIELIRETAQEAAQIKRVLPKSFRQQTGSMLVLDPADVHIGKLCVASETGVRYDQEVAQHRLAEGCRRLAEKGLKNDATRVLFVIGNDIAHIDNMRRTTTSGTPQDTDGSLFSIYKAAYHGYIKAITDILEMGMEVDLIFNPSNHDFVLGFTIAQGVAAWFRGHPNVHATAYNLSEVQRKYFRYGNNLFGFTHGGDAKEKDLPSLMMTEARSHVSECLYRYWYIHHYHHKIKKRMGLNSQEREKDHIGMTQIDFGLGAMEGDNFEIEYVRSPSAPDGWHFRNGYINRQAVEAFVHHPYDGQDARFTEWF